MRIALLTDDHLRRDRRESPTVRSRVRRFGLFVANSISPRASSLRRAKFVRLARYATTSVVAFGVSEATLLILYGYGIVNATLAAMIANLAGTVLSYLLSRYWIWSDAARTRVARQVILYWTTSLICITLTSLATGAIATLAPSGHRFHLAVVAIGFPVVIMVFWLAKFVLYQRVIFPVTRVHRDSSPGPPSGARRWSESHGHTVESDPDDKTKDSESPRHRRTARPAVQGSLGHDHTVGSKEPGNLGLATLLSDRSKG